jgi:lysyl-tRNA synthetase class 2
MQRRKAVDLNMQDLSIFKEVLAARDGMMRAMRAFFHVGGFIEVDTPIRLPAPCLEEYIDAISADGEFLRTSPELHMKRLVCAGFDKIFCVGSCFRRGEFGRLHNPEYAMLEWYRTGTDYMGILDDLRGLVETARRAVGGRALPDWTVMTVSEAFLKYAGWDPAEAYDADRFDEDLFHRVEPALKELGVVVLKDYPAVAAALSRKKPDNPKVAERFELYIHGVEIANAYSELTDAAEQRQRFEACAEARAAAGSEVYPLDEDFLSALEVGMPECGGIAVGMDRLLMVLLGKTSLDEILPFR